MFSNRLASHLERGVVGFPTTLASSVGLIMASPVILTVTSGFGMGGDTFALAVLLAFIMMQAQVTTLCRGGDAHSHHRFGVRLYLLRHGPLLRYHRRAVRLFDRPYLRRDGGDDPGGHYGAGELRVD